MSEDTTAANSVDVPLMPWERSSGGSSVRSAAASLFKSKDLSEAPEDLNESTADEDDESEDASLEGDDFEESDDDEATDDDEGDDSDDDETPDQTPRYKVKVDGEEVEVTLEEALKGYSRESDYTRKTQKLAEERKAHEAERTTVREAREQYAAQLDALGKALEALTPPEPDWDRLRVENPHEFAAQWADHQRSQEQLRAVQAEQQRVNNERYGDHQKQFEAHLAEQHNKLLEAFPDWKDAEKGKAGITKLRDYAENVLGFSGQELDRVNDHRVLVLMDKARQLDALKAKGTKFRDKAKAVPVIEAGVRRSKTPAKVKGYKQARQKLTRSGDVKDAASVIERLIG